MAYILVQQCCPPANHSAEKSRCKRPVSESSGKLTHSGGRIFLPYHSQRLGQYYPHHSVRTMNTLPNLHLSKDRCPTTKRCSVSYRPLNSRVILLKNSGASSAMKCKFRLTIFPWTSIKL